MSAPCPRTIPSASSAATRGRAMDRPVPHPTKISQRFWDSCRQGIFEMQCCVGCGKYSFYPVYLCPFCGSVELSWKELSGTGTVYSCTVVEHSAGAAFDAVTPLVVALIELDEGPIMMSNVVDV